MLPYDSLAESGEGIDSKKRKAITLKICKPRSIYYNNNHYMCGYITN